MPDDWKAIAFLAPPELVDEIDDVREVLGAELPGIDRATVIRRLLIEALAAREVLGGAAADRATRVEEGDRVGEGVRVDEVLDPRPLARRVSRVFIAVVIVLAAWTGIRIAWHVATTATSRLVYDEATLARQREHARLEAERARAEAAARVPALRGELASVESRIATLRQMAESFLLESARGRITVLELLHDCHHCCR